MKLSYHPETDSLYIDLSDRPSAESREISERVVLDYDADGQLVGIDIDNASAKVDAGQARIEPLAREGGNGGRLKCWFTPEPAAWPRQVPCDLRRCGFGRQR